jgi:hypothetical protein
LRDGDEMIGDVFWNGLRTRLREGGAKPGRPACSDGQASGPSA